MWVRSSGIFPAGKTAEVLENMQQKQQRREPGHSDMVMFHKMALCSLKSQTKKFFGDFFKLIRGAIIKIWDKQSDSNENLAWGFLYFSPKLSIALLNN